MAVLPELEHERRRPRNEPHQQGEEEEVADENNGVEGGVTAHEGRDAVPEHPAGQPEEVEEDVRGGPEVVDEQLVDQHEEHHVDDLVEGPEEKDAQHLEVEVVHQEDADSGEGAEDEGGLDHRHPSDRVRGHHPAEGDEGPDDPSQSDAPILDVS